MHNLRHHVIKLVIVNPQDKTWDQFSNKLYPGGGFYVLQLEIKVLTYLKK